jgi:DNA adenine methylase
MDIIAAFPSDVPRLIEPFAGSAALSLAAAYHRRAHSFWINDAHAPLIGLWDHIINQPDELIDKYTEMWRRQAGQERTYYDLIREKFNTTHQPEHFLYLLVRCVKAAIRYNGEGGFNNSPDNRRKGAVPETMRRRIVGASVLLRGRTKLTDLDYKTVLAECGPDDLIYMDPPYQGVGGSRDNRYMPKVNHQEFCEELAALNRRRCRYVVSYDGRTGDKVHGQPLPANLRLKHIELHAGRSTQATLLGRKENTYESLYLSPTIVNGPLK